MRKMYVPLLANGRVAFLRFEKNLKQLYRKWMAFFTSDTKFVKISFED